VQEKSKSDYVYNFPVGITIVKCEIYSHVHCHTLCTRNVICWKVSTKVFKYVEERGRILEEESFFIEIL